MTIWEIYSGQLPWAGMRPLQVAIVVTQENRLLDTPPGSPPAIKALLAACFQRDPTRRPSMDTVEADFPELDEDADAEPTRVSYERGAPAVPAAVFEHEPPAYTLSSQLTLSPTSTEDARTPQVLLLLLEGP